MKLEDVKSVQLREIIEQVRDVLPGSSHLDELLGIDLDDPVQVLASAYVELRASEERQRRLRNLRELARRPVYAHWTTVDGLRSEANAVQSWRLDSVLKGERCCSVGGCQYMRLEGKKVCGHHETGTEGRDLGAEAAGSQSGEEPGGGENAAEAGEETDETTGSERGKNG